MESRPQLEIQSKGKGGESKLELRFKVWVKLIVYICRERLSVHVRLLTERVLVTVLTIRDVCALGRMCMLNMDKDACDWCGERRLGPKEESGRACMESEIE